MTDPGSTRPALHRYHAHAVHRCGAESEIRSSRHPDGRRSDGLLPLAALSALRSGRSRVAEPRPFRAFGRPRLGRYFTVCFIFAGPRQTNSSYKESDRLAVTLEDIKGFRQIGSRCTGHPEYGWTSGVETTTGPLGQGARRASGWRSRTLAAPAYDTKMHAFTSEFGGDFGRDTLSSPPAPLRRSRSVPPTTRLLT